MPRPSRTTSSGAEANLARRVKYEREKRGLSYEALAKAMTDAGCKIQGSAIYKIEKADPPRRITVDELTAFADVFETSVSDLLTDMDLIEQKRAQELIENIQDCQRSMGTLAVNVFNSVSALYDLAFADNADLYEYVVNHLDASDEGQYTMNLGDDSEEGEALSELLLLRMVRANHEHWTALQKAGGLWSKFKAGRWSDDDHKRMLDETERLRAELEVIREGDDRG